MSNLYIINVKHIAPKDSHISIECFLLAENDEAVYAWLDKEKQDEMWSDRNNEDGPCEILDDDYNVIGTESYKEKIIRIRGDINDDDNDYSEAYYGLTLYGWEEIKNPPVGSILILNSLGILNTDITKQLVAK